MLLEKVFYVDSDVLYMNKGTYFPTWFPNWKNISNWYFESGYSFCYNIVTTGDVDQIFIQYGRDDTGWASARFLSNSIVILDQEQQEDGTIKATVKTQSQFFNGRPNNQEVTGYTTNYLVKVNNVTQYQFTANSRDEFENGSKDEITFNITVPPQETNTQLSFEVSFIYPNGEVPNSEFTVGMGLFNPNPLSYIPMSIRKGGNWNDLNANNGKILIRQGSNWIDKSNENRETSRQVNKGHNRIRRGEQWRQLPQMSGGNAID